MGGSTIPWPLPPASSTGGTSSPNDPGAIIKAAQAAAIPVSAGHQLTVPGTLQYAPKQWQDTAKDQRPVVGKKASNARGFENAMIGVGNLIGQIKTEKDNKEKLKIATATQQVLQAQNAVDEAKQQLQQAQASGDQNAIKQAQDVLKHNTDIIKGVMSDDKTWKALQKGFNINYTDPQSNNTLHHQGVQMGKKMAATDEQLQNRASAFEKSLPTQYGPNQQAIALRDQLVLNQKNDLEMQKSLFTLQASMYRTDTMASDTMRVQAGANLRAAFKVQNAYQLQTNKFAHDQELQKNKFYQESALINQRASAAFNLAQNIEGMKDSDPINLRVQQANVLAKQTAGMNSAEARRDALIQQRDNMIPGDPNRDSVDKAITAQTLVVSGMKDQIEASQKIFSTWIKAAGDTNGSNPNSRPSSSSPSGARAVAAPSTDTSEGNDDDEDEDGSSDTADPLAPYLHP